MPEPPPATQATHATLLAKVRDGTDLEAWRRFESTYRELLIRFCRSRGLQHADAEDIVQTVFSRLVHGLRQFEYDPKVGRFRDYLFRCVRNAISDWRCPNSDAECVITDGSNEESGHHEGEERAVWMREWVGHHYRLALEALRTRSDPQSVAVLEATIAGKSPREIAAALAMTEPAVYKAQQRMRLRLRDQIAEQVRDEEMIDG